MKTYYRKDVNIKDNVIPIEKFMEFKEDTYDVLGSVFLEKVQDAVGQTSEVKVLENECRFDNLAYKYMSNADYWWVLMEYNDYIDWEITGDKILKIPDVMNIIQFEQELLIRENLNEMDS